MIDKRLIDYSNQYKDYNNSLEEEGRLFTPEDIMSVIKGFISHYRADHLNNKEKELLANLGKLHNTYHNS